MGSFNPLLINLLHHGAEVPITRILGCVVFEFIDHAQEIAGHIVSAIEQENPVEIQLGVIKIAQLIMKPAVLEQSIDFLIPIRQMNPHARSVR